MKNIRQAYVDYQQRASEFSVGDSVFYALDGRDHIGTVVAVYPAIGMVDVEYPDGNTRLPVEDVQRYETKDVIPPDPLHENVPGGAGSVGLPGGPKTADTNLLIHAERLASAWVKKALYWAAKDRRYKATTAELGGGYTCPKCKETILKAANYQRTEGVSEKLLGCPGCLFLIRRCDILNDPSHQDAQTVDLLAEAA